MSKHDCDGCGRPALMRTGCPCCSAWLCPACISEHANTAAKFDAWKEAAAGWTPPSPS